MPTLLEIGGAEYPKKFKNEKLIPVEGRSLVPFFKGAGQASERVLCFDHFESSAIRKGDWKLVRGNNRYKNRTWELYNLAEDRCETNNLIESHAEKAEELEAEWLAWAKRVKVNPYYSHAQANPAKVRKKLKKDAQGFYLLKHGDQVAREYAPQFANKSIEIKLSVTRERKRAECLFPMVEADVVIPFTWRMENRFFPADWVVAYTPSGPPVSCLRGGPPCTPRSCPTRKYP